MVCLPLVELHQSFACAVSDVILLQANMAAFKVLPSRSAAVRSYTESHVLEALSGHIATVAASGFLFFGSSVLMSNKVGACVDRVDSRVCAQ
jgi:hypothetical protein